jgi:hypothetical protein
VLEEIGKANPVVCQVRLFPDDDHLVLLSFSIEFEQFLDECYADHAKPNYDNSFSNGARSRVGPGVWNSVSIGAAIKLDFVFSNAAHLSKRPAGRRRIRVCFKEGDSSNDAKERG